MKNYYLQNLINECTMLENGGYIIFETDLVKAREELQETKQLLIQRVVFNEAEDCTKCLKLKRTKPNTIQMLCECDASEVELCDCNENTPTLQVGTNGKPFCSKCGKYKHN